ncbi:MAG: NAD(P)H-dependent oxidoreductase [Reichenbachiella sp.]|uniref:flavodoxin family protein n=1 Tax=Reichenbachiella sp. TaxID=2184521 RepID=UPI00326380C0
MKQQNSSIMTVMGSARSDGNTRLVANRFSKISGSFMVDLNQKEISYYDYEHLNKDDDFLTLIRNFVADYDTLVLITPIYWYTMSAQLKNFLDRTSDLLTIEKDLGRQLRGKSLALISQTEGDHFEPWFAEPIRMTAEYLGMNYLGHKHVSIENNKISPEMEKRLAELFHTIE